MKSKICEYILDEKTNIRAIYARNIFHCFPCHSHESFLIGVVLNGERVIDSNGDTQIRSQGELFKILPYKDHSCSCFGKNGADYFTVSIPVDVIRDGLDMGIMEISKDDVVRESDITDVLSGLQKELTGDGRAAIVDCLVAKVVAFCQQEYYLAFHDVCTMPRQLEWGLKFIKENYRKKMLLEDISISACMSQFHFHRLFKKYIGTSPAALINKERIAYSIEEMATGEQLGMLAIASGFSDQSHLCRVFKKITGVTAKNYELVKL